MVCFYVTAKLIFLPPSLSPSLSNPLTVSAIILFPFRPLCLLHFRHFPHSLAHSLPPSLARSPLLFFFFNFPFLFSSSLFSAAFSCVSAVMVCVSSGFWSWLPAYHIKDCDGMIRLLWLSKEPFSEKEWEHSYILYACAPKCIKRIWKTSSRNTTSFCA